MSMIQIARLLTVPLDQLEPGKDENARQSVDDVATVRELAASILTDGLLQPLLVWRGAMERREKDDAVFVVDGNRRLAALNWLKFEGTLPEGLNSVPAIESDAGSLEAALRQSLSANELRVPLHPVDRYRAFARSMGQGKSTGQIALAYAVPERAVKQSLALGELHAEVLQAWRDGQIEEETARAFTLTPDQDMQLATFRRLQKAVRLHPDHVREALIGAESVGHLVEWVTPEKYEESGGQVLRDLFGTDHGVSDRALLHAMAGAKLEGFADAALASGWVWAETLDAVPPAARTWTRLDIKPRFTPEQRARREEIVRRVQTISRGADDHDGHEEDYGALVAELKRLDQEGRMAGATAKQRAVSGCILSVDPSGALLIEYGVVRPAEQKEVPAKDLPPGRREARQKKKAADGMSDALALRLSVSLTKAVAECVAEDTRVALALLAAGLTCVGPMRVTADGPSSVKKRSDFAASFHHMRSAKVPTRSAAMLTLTAVAAAALDFTTQSAAVRPVETPIVAAICDALDRTALQRALRDHFDAKDYFDSAPSRFALDAIADVMGKAVADQEGSKSAATIKKIAIGHCAKAGWLPRELRTSAYKGPTAKRSRPG